jgi:H+/Cl- antiporter ClcA
MVYSLFALLHWRIYQLPFSALVLMMLPGVKRGVLSKITNQMRSNTLGHNHSIQHSTLSMHLFSEIAILVHIVTAAMIITNLVKL